MNDIASLFAHSNVAMPAIVEWARSPATNLHPLDQQSAIAADALTPAEVTDQLGTRCVRSAVTGPCRCVWRPRWLMAMRVADVAWCGCVRSELTFGPTQTAEACRERAAGDQKNNEAGRSNDNAEHVSLTPEEITTWSYASMVNDALISGCKGPFAEPY